QPEGPSSAKNSPRTISRVSVSTAGTAPKRLLIASKRTSGALSPALRPRAAPLSVAIDSPFRAHTLTADAATSTRRRRHHVRLCGQGSPHRLLPAGIFPLALAGVHLGFEAPVKLPLCRKAGQVGADAGRAAGKVGCAERGCFQNRRPVHRACENIGQELHARIACG